jgi:hypothetical protein
VGWGPPPRSFGSPGGGWGSVSGRSTSTPRLGCLERRRWAEAELREAFRVIAQLIDAPQEAQDADVEASMASRLEGAIERVLQVNKPASEAPSVAWGL